MYLGGLGAYYLKNGQAVDTLYVGDTMTFNVPGFSQVWLDQYQNGQLQYSGAFNLPMPPYVLQTRDVGSFTASVFELKPNGQKGDNIGTDRVQVLAAPSKRVTCQQGSGDQISVMDFDNACPPGWQPWMQYTSPRIQVTQAPVYTQGTVPTSGGGVIATGIPTPSAPPTVIVSAPSGPLDLSTPYTPIDTGNQQGPPETQQAGFDMLPLLLIAGAGLYFVFGGKRP